jgi:hypothetical protein
VVKRQTIKKRMRSKLQDVRQELRKRWHERVAATGEWLRSVVQGYFNYHAVPGNFAALQVFRREVVRAWLKTLRRRSQRHRLPWEQFRSITDFHLPLPRILHPQPGVRFDAKHPKVRAVCAKVRPYGSVRGAYGNGCPYRDFSRIKSRIAALQLSRMKIMDLSASLAGSLFVRLFVMGAIFAWWDHREKRQQ